MASPTSRLLELLELLQTRPLTTGREIADRLGIDARTARRYVGVLQELGIPVEGQRGVGGGYRIRPGYRLPPLMLGDEEAVAVVLGLLATRGTGGEGPADVVDRALEKINRVLPATLRRQVEALEETLEFTRTRGSAPADAAAARRIPPTLAELVDDPDGTLLRMRVDSLDWMATVLAGLGCGFTIRRPDELRASVGALAAQLAAAAR